MVDREGSGIASDRALVVAARAGSAAAFAALVERYQAPLRRTLARLSDDPELAADLAQETFEAAFRGPDHLADDDCFAPWLYVIARNRWRQNEQRRLIARPIPGAAVACPVAPVHGEVGEVRPFVPHDQQYPDDREREPPAPGQSSHNPSLHLGGIHTFPEGGDGGDQHYLRGGMEVGNGVPGCGWHPAEECSDEECGQGEQLLALRPVLPPLLRSLWPILYRDPPFIPFV